MEKLQESLPEGLSQAAVSIPGFGVIAQLLSSKLGLDVGNLMSFYLLMFGLYQAVMYIYTSGRDFLLDYGTAAVRIEDYDDLYAHFITWISAQRMTELSRDLKASSKKPRARRSRDDYDDSDDEDGDADSDNDEAGVLDESGLFNYGKWAGNTPVYYEPNIGDDSFYHNGHYFQFRKDEKENKYERRFENFIVIRCRGRSTQPIKDLITHVKEWSRAKQHNVTAVSRPEPNQGDDGGFRYWQCVANRPSRPMSTVTLDEEQKARVVADINDYLLPSTARWYAARGIPHRRGYLFHGPPGTGKTSLSFALAGIFGLDLYCVSLGERGLGEGDLARLFYQLPDRCIILLEDIDSAGIRRDNDNGSDEPSSKQVDSSQRDTNGNGELTNGTTTPNKGPDSFVKINNGGNKSGQSNVSLAGLLNIIDGAASQEGRVMIMTTNYPEKLDAALIRPGRVDLQIKFTLATREQIREIFRRMYSNENDVKKNDKTQKNGKLTPTKAVSKSVTYSPELSPARLAELADQFADRLPEDTFSPAEIQGYLLMKKIDPVGAIEGVGEWKEALLEARKKGTKVIEVK